MSLVLVRNDEKVGHIFEDDRLGREFLFYEFKKMCQEALDDFLGNCDEEMIFDRKKIFRITVEYPQNKREMRILPKIFARDNHSDDRECYQYEENLWNEFKKENGL